MAVATTVEITPYRVEIAAAQMEDLGRRIAAPQSPTRDLAAAPPRGARLAATEARPRYGAHDYDSRPLAERLNALPQSTTEIDGRVAPFTHVRSARESPLP